MTETIYLALGSNVGDREKNLKAAIKLFSPKIKRIASSAIYETPPWGFEDQAAFLNMAVHAETSLKPADLLTYLKEIEVKLGRQETFKNGPREIDLDILFYGDSRYRKDGLLIPHPRLHERAFVLVPLADIAFDFKHPTLRATIGELLVEIPAKEIKAIKVYANAD